MIELVNCSYCGGNKPKGQWHSCRRAKVAQKRLGGALKAIEEMQRGGQEVWGSRQDVANYRGIRNDIRATGGQVKTGWWDNDSSPLNYHINSQER